MEGMNAKNPKYEMSALKSLINFDEISRKKGKIQTNNVRLFNYLQISKRQ